MRTLAWDRGRILSQIRDRIWLYLSSSADTEELALEAGALLDLREQDVFAIARALFLLCDEVQAFLADVPDLLRRLPTSSAQVEERSAERIRGSIRWQATLLARRSSGMPNLYITAPAERAYQTPENELLVFLLDAITVLGQQIGWDASKGPAASVVNSRAADASRLLSSRMLTTIDRRPPSPRRLARVRTGRHRRRFQSALDLFERYETLIGHLHRPSLKDAVEQGGLVVQPNDKLFEIYVFFLVLDWLKHTGWTLPPPRVFRGGLKVTARRGNRSCDVHYQSVPRSLSRDSRYQETSIAHGFPGSHLRPDLTIVETFGEATNTLMVELKMGTHRTAIKSVREALKDLLAYEASFEVGLANQTRPVGLGLAWGSGLAPVDHRIMLATVDHLTDGLELFLAATATSNPSG